MVMLRNKQTRLVVLLMLSGLMSCATERVAVQQLPGTADPNEELNELQQRVEAGYEKELNLLSPTFFRDARSSLKEAKDRMADKKSNQDILEEISVGNANISKAESVGRLSRLALGQPLAERAEALKFGADRVMPKQLAEADDQLRKAAVDVERGNTGKAQGKRGELVAHYRQLQEKTLTRSKLDPARVDIERAKDLGAKKFAPKTLAETEKAYEQAEKVIEQDPKDLSEIEQQAELAREQADFLVKVTRETKRHGDSSAELAVVETLRQQEQIASLREESQEQAAELSQERERISELESQQQRFQKAKAMFKPEEAEFLRRNGETIIRLKGLEFQVGKSQVPSRDFDLLSRVARAIQLLDAEQVTVEGHTDSTGSRKINEKLSAERAESVKDFLVANEAVAEDQIQSEGKAFSEPIASNETSQGRALNRRVDIRVDTVG